MFYQIGLTLLKMEELLFVTLDASVTISLCKKEADNLHPVGNTPLVDSVLEKEGNYCICQSSSSPFTCLSRKLRIGYS